MSDMRLALTIVGIAVAILVVLLILAYYLILSGNI